MDLLLIKYTIPGFIPAIDIYQPRDPFASKVKTFLLLERDLMPRWDSFSHKLWYGYPNWFEFKYKEEILCAM
jgi:hypothetical protein